MDILVLHPLIEISVSFDLLSDLFSSSSSSFRLDVVIIVDETCAYEEGHLGDGRDKLFSPLSLVVLGR
jgi:hypothetical protein